MIGRLASWLTANPLEVLSAALCASVILMGLSIHLLRAELAAVTSQRDAATATVLAQNERIEALASISKAKTELADKAMQMAEQSGRANLARAGQILSRPIPAGDVECSATLDLLREYQ